MNDRDLLLKSLDSALSPEEQRQLEQALAESADLRREREELLAMRAALQGLHPPSDTGFPDRVMQRVVKEGKPETAFIVGLFPRVAAACIALLLAFLLSVYLAEGNLTTDALLGTQELTVDNAYSLVDSEELTQ